VREVDLASLRAEFPLAARWRAPEVFTETLALGGLEFGLVGLCAESTDGRQVTGSAGSVQDSALIRAYFELSERAALLDAYDGSDYRFRTFDATGQPLGYARRSELFPESPAPEEWQFSKSNGAAAGASWADACSRARWELIERDRVLGAWEGETAPCRLPSMLCGMPRELEQYYDFEAYGFPSSHAPRAFACEVAGVFGFPKMKAAPLVYGFGARATSAEAISAAAVECLQRLGFLWGESIPESEPPFAPTPEFHQEYFLHPKRHIELLAWLKGAHHAPRRAMTPIGETGQARRFVDLTPRGLRQKLAVVKALPQGERPLRFGRFPHGSGRVRELGFHPIP
jgi:hypothetical protein